MLLCVSTDSRNRRFEQIIKRNKDGAEGGRENTLHLTGAAMGYGSQPLLSLGKKQAETGRAGLMWRAEEGGLPTD